MFDNLKNMAGLVGQAKQIQEKAAQLKAELARKTVEADAGAGAVRVVMNGKFEVLRVHVDWALIATFMGEGSELDQTMVEELIAGAFNAAVVKTQQLLRDELAKLTGGLNIPGLDKMLGGITGE